MLHALTGSVGVADLRHHQVPSCGEGVNVLEPHLFFVSSLGTSETKLATDARYAGAVSMAIATACPAAALVYERDMWSIWRCRRNLGQGASGSFVVQADDLT